MPHKFNADLRDKIPAEHQLHPNPVRRGKRQDIGGMADVILGGKQSGPTDAAVKELHAIIGRLAAENVFCPKG